MSLTKRQKRFLIENCKFLTLYELSKKTGIDEKDIDSYLKKNNKKAIITSNSGDKKLGDNKSNKQDGHVNNISIKAIFKKSWKFLICISIGILILYFNSLHGNFVSDDYASISQNPDVGSFKVMFNGGNSATLTNYFINLVFGHDSPVAYHVVSLLLYIIFIWVAYVTIMLIFDDKRVANITTILFSCLPIHVEAVSWISGRIYLLISLWVMLGFISFIYFLRNEEWKYLILTACFFGFGFLTDKPRPFALVLIIILYLLYAKVDIRKLKIFKYWPLVIGAILIIFFAAWPNIMNRITSVNSGYNVSDSIFYNPFFQYPTAMAKYLQLLFIPTDLTLYHTMYILPTWLNWLILITYIFGVIYFYFKDKRIFFALVFIFAATAPSMTPVKVSWLVAERYIFLGSLGFCLFLAIVLDKIWRKNALISTAIIAILIPFYSVRVYLRNIDWQTNHNLWVNTCQVSPNSHNAWNNIGDDYDKLKQYENSIKGFTQSTVVKPNYADAYHNRANIFYKMGRFDLARDSYETALKFSPGLYQTYFSLVQIDLMENRLDLAMQHAETVAKIQPNNPQVLYILSVVYVQTGKQTEAKNILEFLVNNYPQFTAASELYKQIKK